MIDLPSGLRLVALTTHASEVPSDSREAFVKEVQGLAADPRAILLHTCHRAELYLLDEPGEGWPLVSLPLLPSGGRRLEGIDVVRHLMSLAAGLESVVVGEDQILHQLRECLTLRHRPYRPDDGRAARGAGDALGLHPVLQRLLEVALHLGREVRSGRQGSPPSLADVAVARLATQAGPLAGRRVLVVGAGRMGRLAARSAAGHGARVLIANRSRDGADALAREIDGAVADFGPWAPPVPADGVLLALSGSWPLSASAREALLRDAYSVVDLSSPPALAPGLRAALGGRYTSVDDLARDGHQRQRARLRPRMERALDEAEASFVRWAHARSAVPTIRALGDQAEMRRVEELERLFRRTELPEHQRELVEQMSRRLVAGLLHEPFVRLGDDPDGSLERAARSLFSL